MILDGKQSTPQSFTTAGRTSQHFTSICQSFSFARSAVSDSQVTAVRAGVPEARAAGALANEDFVRAVDLYEPLATAQPADARVVLAYANALLGAKRYKDSRAKFDRAKSIGGIAARDLGVPAAKASALDNDADGAVAWLKTIPPAFIPAFQTLFPQK